MTSRTPQELAAPEFKKLAHDFREARVDEILGTGWFCPELGHSQIQIRTVTAF